LNPVLKQHDVNITHCTCNGEAVELPLWGSWQPQAD